MHNRYSPKFRYDVDIPNGHLQKQVQPPNEICILQ